MKVPVQRSAPVKMIIIKPYGKKSAPKIRAGPGALVCSYEKSVSSSCKEFFWGMRTHGEVLAVKAEAAATESKQPALTAEIKTRRGCILALCTPARLTISVTSEGVYAFTVKAILAAVLRQRAQQRQAWRAWDLRPFEPGWHCTYLT